MALLLPTVVIALSGVLFVPQQSITASKSAERFPCENCACGCPSAAHCWDRCCCHTDAEKIAWARRHGVTPPRFLIERVAASASSQPPDACESCCHCCVKSSDPTKSSGDDADAEAVELKTILLWKSAQCRGVQLLWTLLALDWLESSSAGIATPLHQYWIATADIRGVSIHSPPDPPVPWHRSIALS
ncbi:MAG: hypothetical protein AAF539_00780 [Planctomycetota bacterium]